MVSRYAKQVIFSEIGEDGQQKLGRSRVVIIGCGALGSITASILVRAGIGTVRIIDRDFIETHNLQRQILFDEKDIEERLPKAVAAERYLKKVNSSISIEGIVADVNYTNIEKFVEGFDLIMDGLDNLETRYLINDVSLKKKIPWIYGAAVSSMGMTMTIIPHETPCLRCYSPYPAEGPMLSCDTSGVISPAPVTIGALQATEAIKVLIGSDNINRDLIYIDLWTGTFNRVKTHSMSDCPPDNGKYDFLDGKTGSEIKILCGQNAVQISRKTPLTVSLPQLAARLEHAGKVTYNEFMLNFEADGSSMVCFPDGRTIIKNTVEESEAKGVYARYIGL